MYVTAPKDVNLFKSLFEFSYTSIQENIRPFFFFKNLKKKIFFLSTSKAWVWITEKRNVPLLSLCWFSVWKFFFSQRNSMKRNKTVHVLPRPLQLHKPVSVFLASNPAIYYYSASQDMNNHPMILHFCFSNLCWNLLLPCNKIPNAYQKTFFLRQHPLILQVSRLESSWTKWSSHRCRPCWNIVHTLYRDYTEIQKSSAHERWKDANTYTENLFQ